MGREMGREIPRCDVQLYITIYTEIEGVNRGEEAGEG
jgi:hypothetical protein